MKARTHRLFLPASLLASLLSLWAAGAILGPGAPAAAQPMMLDPSQMSGIPRPDPQVPAGTITVRLIRGELQNRLTGAEVELANLAKPGDKQVQKTDAEGRATFSGLGQGTYEARAAVDGEALASQPIELPEAPGVRVMLVFSKSVADQQKELGTPDGKARVDKQLPPGELLVKVLGPGGQALAGLKVIVNHADRDTEQVDALPEKESGPDGVARFQGLKNDPGDGYLVTVMREGAGYRSKPFRLTREYGTQIVMEIRPTTRDSSQLRIANGSHLILEMDDDMVQVLENLRLHNPLEQSIDPGPGGLRVPLAEGALSAQVVPGSPSALSIDVSHEDRPPEAVWKGSIPPGDTELRLGFILKQRGTLSFRQPATVAFEALRIIIEKTPELKVEGTGLSMEQRKFNGKDLLLISAPAPQPGGQIEFTLTGLPAATPVLRYAAAVLALGIIFAFGLVAARGTGPRDDLGQRQRQRLEQRRQALLEQLLSLDREGDEGQEPQEERQGRKKAGPAKSKKQLMAELEQVYRELDSM